MGAELMTIARVVHVVGVVLWIGGVAFTTTVVIPMLRRVPNGDERLRVFQAIEGRFALQARVVTLITGAAGFYMLQGLDAWWRYQAPSFWWVHLMTLVWFAFTLVLFILEPLFLNDWFKTFAERDSDRAFRLMHRFHIVLLTLSLVAIVGGVAGVRGFLRFG
jgi:uncharacterized membrane protein